MKVWVFGVILILLGCYPLDSSWDPYSPNYLPPGRLVFQPASGLDFGSIELNTVLQQNLSFTNEGKRELIVQSVDLEGSGFLPGSISLPQTLAPAQGLGMHISIDSTTLGNHHAQLVIGTSRGAYRVDLRGTVEPPGSLSPNLVVIQGKNDRYVTYHHLNTFQFGGDRSADFNSWQVPFRVLNKGNMTATQVSLSFFAADFVIHGSFTNITILSGQTSPEFRIQFPAGTASGLVTGVLTVTSSNHPSLSVNIEGNVLPASPILKIVDRNDSQYFVSDSLAVPLPLVFRDHLFVNTGQGGLTVLSITSAYGKIDLDCSLPIYLNTGEYSIFKLRKMPSVSAGPDVLNVTTDQGAFTLHFEAP